MKAVYVTAALCVLGALLVPVKADMPTATPTLLFSEWVHAVRAGAPSRAKVMGGHAEPETKHICLQETKQYNCRYVGCPNINAIDPALVGTTDLECASSNAGCANCRQNTVFQSDLTCCGDEKPYGYGRNDELDGFGSGINAPTLKIGTCDWDFTLTRTFPAEQLGKQRRQPPSFLEASTKIGTAWATCFLTPGADYCGDVLCDKMVLTFKGGVYEATVQSTLPADLATSLPSATCLTDDSFVPDLVFPDLGDTRRARNVTLYEGIAQVMSGTVTITSLDREVEYTHGYMDYVARFTPTVDDTGGLRRAGGASATGLAVVTPNTYNLKLVSKKKGYASS